MTVSELIAKLQTMPQDMRVVTGGFDESNFDDIETIETIKLRLNVNSEWSHCGQHSEFDDGVPCLYIDR